jgi:hypothetical protein
MKVFIVLREYDETGFSNEIDVFSNYTDAEKFKRQVEFDYFYISHFKQAVIIEEEVKQTE